MRTSSRDAPEQVGCALARVGERLSGLAIVDMNCESST
jgi:hypothetical protein